MKQSQLARHLKRKPRDEKLVRSAIMADKKSHDEILENIRKLGMDKYNQKELGKTNPILERERRSKQVSITTLTYLYPKSN